jgi:alginate O-acetyltransferase complex protein AlgI
MLFSSPIFFVFFVAFFTVYVVIPEGWRVWAIIVGSTVFYAWWRIDYVWIPYALALIAFFGMRFMAAAASRDAERRRLILTLICLFAPLVVFKYTGFLYREIIKPLTGANFEMAALALPLGVSFVTFTLTADVVDVYRRKFRGEQRLPTLLAYVLFFPHLIAGPILRPHELIPQLGKLRSVLGAQFTLSIAIFTLGLFKKLVIADPLSDSVDQAFAAGGAANGWTLLLGIYAFAAQIYCDFSGYTDMAIGLALLLRVKLPSNFRRPYMSRSLVEFWRRWHITLSFWLRDYLYIPLGGNRGSMLARMRNIVVTMALGGLWHGANWTFVVWGLYHGCGIALTHLLRRLGWGKMGFATPSWLKILVTFHVVTLGWIFFRAPTIHDAWRIITSFSTLPWSGFSAFAGANLFPLGLLALFFLTHAYDNHARLRLAVRRLPRPILWPALLLPWILAIAVSQGSSGKFIYFDF